MSQSLTAIYIHLIFHVKTTSVAIIEEDHTKLFAYVSGILNNYGCTSIAVGGMRDHLHLLFRLGPTMSVAQVVERVKVASHYYLQELRPMYDSFAWQSGYGAFSVSPSNIDKAKDYVLHQREHHRDKDFSKEYLIFLRGNKVDFDERYVFRD